MKPVNQELDEKLVLLSPTRLRARQGRAKVCQLAHSSAQVDAKKNPVQNRSGNLHQTQRWAKQLHRIGDRQLAAQPDLHVCAAHVCF
jgi:hypothetical protein